MLLETQPVQPDNRSARRKLSDSKDIELLASAIERCAKLLPMWVDIEKSNLKSTNIKGGLTNALYRVHTTAEVNPKQVLVRFFGHGTDAFIDRDKEDLILKALDEKEGVSVPRIFARFPAGRIEEWIESIVLHVSELPPFSAEIAKMLIHFHNTEVPELSREPILLATIEKWVHKIAKRNLYSNGTVALEIELAFLKDKLQEIQSPIVFAHNDLQENNILHNATTHELHFIDFEYSNYNYRGFDFGNHFCEWTIEYSDKLEHGFQITLDNYPSKEQKINFFNSYLSEKKLEPEALEKEIASLLRESELFTLFSHFYWGLWGIIQNQQSSINFNYEQYATERFNCYLHHKKLFVF